MRFAHLLFLKGETLAALVLTQSQRQNLNKNVDRAILCQADGLERKINSTLSRAPSLPNSINNMNQYITRIDSRIRHRELKKHFSQNEIGEDPLGDVIDLVENQKDGAFEAVKDKQLFGLLPRVFGLPLGVKGLYLGPHRRDLIVLNGSDIDYIDHGVTAPLKKLIIILSGREFKSKEFLVRQIWGYEYNSLIHDSVLYATIGKLRKIIGSALSWVEWANEGYRLNPEIRVFSATKELRPEQQSKLANENTRLKIEEFNLRQLKLIRYAKSGESITVRNYMKKNKICGMTAFRDLASLHKSGHLVRIGKGRATVYIINARS